MISRRGSVAGSGASGPAALALVVVAGLLAISSPSVGDAQDEPEASIDATPSVSAVPRDQPVVERFVSANQAYEAGQYPSAIELYIGLLEDGLESGDLLYNLGNAHLRNGELGRAIAAYRRAELLSPRDEDLLANLQFARQSNKDALEPPAPSALAATILFWHYRLGYYEVARAALVLNALFWTLLLLRLMRPGLQGLVGTALIAGALLAALGGSLLWRQLAPERIGVVVPQEVGARTAPDLDSIVRFNLHAGAEVEVEAEEGDWVRIALPDGQRGWIERRWLEVVEL